MDDVGHIVVDGGAEEDDAIHHQAAEHIHLGHVELTFLDDGGADVATVIDFGDVLLKTEGAQSDVLGGVFEKFVVDLLGEFLS